MAPAIFCHKLFGRVRLRFRIPEFAGLSFVSCARFSSIRIVLFGSIVVLVGVFTNGCVSKATAQAQAHAAFLAGQQQALERMQQIQPSGATVTCIGEVRNRLLPWTADLTLAKAILAADYYGRGDPTSILLIRDGRQTVYDPKKLLQGADVLLEPRDVVEIRP